MKEDTKTRIESELEVKSYIQNLRYALDNDAGRYGNATAFVMSFHFAEKAFKPEMFPYRIN